MALRDIACGAAEQHANSPLFCTNLSNDEIMRVGVFPKDGSLAAVMRRYSKANVVPVATRRFSNFSPWHAAGV